MGCLGPGATLSEHLDTLCLYRIQKRRSTIIQCFFRKNSGGAKQIFRGGRRLQLKYIKLKLAKAQGDKTIFGGGGGGGGGNVHDICTVHAQPFHILLIVMAWLSSNRTRPNLSTHTERSPRGDTEILATVRRSSGMLVL